jgi:hypothetical protein
MTEEEWLVCDNPDTLFDGLPLAARGLRRKWRLVARACLDPFRGWMRDERVEEILESLARDADGVCSPEEFRRAQSLASALLREVVDDASEQRWYRVQLALAEAVHAAVQDAWEDQVPWTAAACAAAKGYVAVNEPEEAAHAREARHQAELSRDIFGNPFRPVALAPAWRTSDVLLLARGIYDAKAFDRMPILADALQEAGCTNEDVLNHCRDPKQVHVRGCWVLDLLLQK